MSRALFCGARCRNGRACRSYPVNGDRGNGRCRMHGGNALAWAFAPRWGVTHGAMVRELITAGWLPEGTRSASFTLVERFLETQRQVTPRTSPNPPQSYCRLDRRQLGEREYRLLLYVSLAYPLRRIARELGLSRATLYRLLARDSNLRATLEEARHFAQALRQCDGSRERISLLIERFGLEETQRIVKAHLLP